jgi:hypothetical protein
MNLKSALRSIRQYKLPRTRALERELDSVRAAHQTVAAELEQVRGEFGQAHDEDQHRITSLQTRLAGLEEERAAAQREVRSLQDTLDEARATFERAHEDDRQQITLLRSQLGDIEYDRNAAREQVLTLEQSLEQVRAEFEHARSSDSKQIAALQSQLVQIESDRTSARQQVRLLEETLRQAEERQAATERRLRALEADAEQAHDRRESELSLARDALSGLQTEQRSMLSMQSEMMRSFGDAGTMLVRAARSRPPLWQQALFACLLFATGALATALILRETRVPPPELSRISGGIDDLQLLMQTHFRTHEDLLETLTRVLGGLSEEVPAPKPAPVPDVLAPDDHVQLDVLPGEQVRQVQRDLETLGFDIGPAGVDGIRGTRTARALGWFRTLYLPDQPDASMQELEDALQFHAGQARVDARRYRLDSAVTAAIRLGSLRTGVEFPYLMELASVESSFNPHAEAKTTSAAGLYQFKEVTWLEALGRHGDAYGLGRYVRAIEFAEDETGRRVPQIRDAALRREVLDLRFNPGLSALLAAEKVRDGKQRLAGKLAREPARADLYLTHFFGLSGALSFLDALASEPDRIAGEIFPGPARRNRNIFQRRNSTLRTVSEVYRVLERKFNTSRFEDG